MSSVRTIRNRWKRIPREGYASSVAFQFIDVDAPFLFAEIKRLQNEVSVLRRYGNKDCTAQADAALEGK